MPIPAALVPFGPILLALLVGGAAAWASRAKARQVWLRPALAAACFVGWAAMEPFARLRAAAVSAEPSPAILLVPAVAVAALEALRAWRGGRHGKALGFAGAAVLGWWLQRGAGTGEHWRVGIVVALLAGWFLLVTRGAPERAAAAALAFAGAAAVAGLPTAWPIAALVLAAACLPAASVGAIGAVSATLPAAVLSAAVLARGHLPHGRVVSADLAAIASCLAPLLIGPIARRVSGGKRRGAGQAAALLPPAGAGALAIAAFWIARRIMFG